MSPKKAIELLDFAMLRYGDGERYFIDLSGKGEPLLCLKTILAICDWAKQRQDKERKEFVVQLITNGTLLCENVVEVLQRKGVLFGISIDGTKACHDRCRKDKHGNPTFDRIMANVRNIKNKEFVGVGVSIGSQIFPLLETIIELSSKFKTISVRPLRGSEGISTEVEPLWEKEYDRLTLRLLDDGLRGDSSLFLPLMNGDDYFGRYLVMMFSYSRSLFRCDAGLGRIAIEDDFKFYPCPALACHQNYELPLDRWSFESELLAICSDCPLKLACGGDCLADIVERKAPNVAMCALRKHLVALAALIEKTVSKENIAFALYLQQFSIEKLSRRRKNERLHAFADHHPELTFSEAKVVFDRNPRSY